MKKSCTILGLLTLFVCFPVKAMDNLKIARSLNTTNLTANPSAGEFGGVRGGTSGKISFTIKNMGNSAVMIKKIEVIGSNFALFDTNTYPFEVIADSVFTNPIGSGGKFLIFQVHFVPNEVGILTSKVVITYGSESDETFEIPLSGEMISCSAARVANPGLNWAPKQAIWFKYTADKFSIVEVNSCNPNQSWIGSDYWEIALYIFYDCCEHFIPGHPEPMFENCPYDPYAESQTTVMQAGETIYIYWRTPPGAPHDKDGFYFNINVTPTIDGDVCENAIPLTLPVINLFGNTRGLNNDYIYSPCSPITNYMDGNDIVYTVTLPGNGYLIGDIMGAYGSIHVLDDCPKEEMTKDHCKAFAGGPNGGHFRRKFAAGTYYVIISNWAPPQTFDYLLNLSWENVSAIENGKLAKSLNVFPNPTRDRLTLAINNDEPTDLTIELVNISGQIVYRSEVKAVFSLTHEIDVSQYSKGVYYLKAYSNEELEIRKVVID